MANPVSPNDEQLAAVLRVLRSENPTLGLTKFHALLLKTHTEWRVSEKRFRRVVQQHGLSATRSAAEDRDAASDDAGKTYPTFRTMDRLDVGQWTTKVGVTYFGRKKGKGLVAKEKIPNGDHVWKEDPWILAPEWEIYYAQEASLACTHCTTPLSSDSRLVLPCPAAFPCTARFCNRLCLSKSAAVHPLLCRARNPAAAPLLDYAKSAQWIGLHALAQQTARLLLANEKGADERDAQWGIVRGFAEMGMEDRVKENGQTASAKDRAAWKNAFKLYLEAFRTPKDASHKKKLARILKQPLPPEIESQFLYEGFLKGLGRMNLNLEAHGGLYVLHSHLNHSCEPNISVRHLDQRSALARITLVALKDIEPGQELVITYVNPSMGVRERRRQLLEWGFGMCNCTCCVREAADLPPEDAQHSAVIPEGDTSSGGGDSRVDMADLERELRDGFGL